MSGKQIKIIPDKGTDPNDTQQELQGQRRNAFPVVHGKATDALALMAGKKMTENKLSGKFSITEGEVLLTMETGNGTVPAKLGVSTHKLLTRGMIEFSAVNHVGGKNGKVQTLDIYFPLKEYAELCGLDVTEHPKNTQEEQKKEAERAKNAWKHARRKAVKDLSLLKVSNLSWRENIKSEDCAFVDCGILQNKGITKSGYIYMQFGTTIAEEYLIRLPMTQYPKALFKVDERNENAYSIGLKISEHYYMDNNQRRGTCQRLKVKTLLRYMNLPDIEHVRENRLGWETFIKEPFEKALDALFKCGMLSDWEYTKAKGIPMPDDEAGFENYEKWAETMVQFTLADPEDQTARIERRDKERKKRQSQQKSTKNKKTDRK